MMLLQLDRHGRILYVRREQVDSYAIHFFIFLWRCKTISDLMINEQIRDKEVRLIGENGEQLGVMPAKEALKEYRWKLKQRDELLREMDESYDRAISCT